MFHLAVNIISCLFFSSSLGLEQIPHFGHINKGQKFVQIDTSLGGKAACGKGHNHGLKPHTHTHATVFHDSGMAWAATFAPHPHYPEGWQQPAQQWAARDRQANGWVGRPWERRGYATLAMLHALPPPGVALSWPHTLTRVGLRCDVEMGGGGL